MSSDLKWLYPNSLKKFTDIGDIIVLIIPSSFFYFDNLPKMFFCPKYLLILITILLGIILYLYSIWKKYKNYEKAISEVLETGYFLNYFDKIARSLKQKLLNKQLVNFTFSSKPGTIISINPDKIKVKVILPSSHEKLVSIINEIDGITERTNLESGEWVNAKYDNVNNSVIIYECPRTLLAISKYLINGENTYTEKQSAALHKVFNDKFDDDWKKNPDNIPSKIFSKEYNFSQ